MSLIAFCQIKYSSIGVAGINYAQLDPFAYTRRIINSGDLRYSWEVPRTGYPGRVNISTLTSVAETTLKPAF